MGNIPERYAADREALAAGLKKVREARFRSGTAAAKALGWSQPKISKIENGTVLPSTDDVEHLLKVCGASSARRSVLLETVNRLHNTMESNRTVLRRGAARKQQRIAQVEADATALRYFSPSVIPGLLQTGEYMRRVFSLELSGAALTRAMNARIERRQVLYDTTKRFTFLLTEAALCWGFVPPEVMTAQVGHIITLSTLANVTIGVIPLSAPVGDVPLHGFEVFDDRLVTIGLEHATITVTEPRDIATYTRMLSVLTESAYFGDDARTVLARVIGSSAR